METNERIKKLTERYKDKSLTRAERAEVMQELARERYRLDPRKPITLRKQTFIDAVITLLDAAAFLFMGFADHFGLHGSQSGESTGAGATVIACIAAALFAAVIVWAVIQKSRYKLEPGDELSQRNMMKANSYAFAATSAMVLAAAVIYFHVIGNETLVLRRESTVSFVVGWLMFVTFVGKAVFLILDGGEVQEEE